MNQWRGLVEAAIRESSLPYRLVDYWSQLDGVLYWATLEHRGTGRLRVISVSRERFHSVEQQQAEALRQIRALIVRFCAPCPGGHRVSHEFDSQDLRDLLLKNKVELFCAECRKWRRAENDEKAALQRLVIEAS